MKTQGITLTEILIGLGILAVLGLFLWQIYLNYLSSAREQNVKISLSLRTQTALNEMITRIREAQNISGETTINEQEYLASSQVLILKFPEKTVVFALDSATKQLFKIEEEKPDKILANDVSQLSFTLNQPDFTQVSTVEIKLTLSQSFDHRTETVSLTDRALLRNR